MVIVLGYTKVHPYYRYIYVFVYIYIYIFACYLRYDG